MSDLKRFEEIEYKATDSQYAKDYAQGYNDCLSQTNAKELYEALLLCLKTLDAMPGHSFAQFKAKAALTKPTNQ